MFVYIVKWELGYAANDSGLFRYAVIISDTGDKIKYGRFPKNIETQQQNTKENTKKTTEMNRD